MITELLRREVAGGKILNLKTRVLSAATADRVMSEWTQQAQQLLDYLDSHALNFQIQPAVRQDQFTRSSTSIIVESALIRDQFVEVLSPKPIGSDTLFWYWGWDREWTNNVLGQEKKRLLGVFIKARRTRSARHNYTYLRVPHK